MPNAPAALGPNTTPQIKSRQPTGEIGYPLILLSGDEKAGKSLVPVVLSRSKRVGMTYWIDLGEGAADEYAILPGARYEVIEHDGSYRQILEQVTAIWHEANRAARQDEPPVVIVVDSMSAEWTMLTNWTNDRARRSRTGQRKLQQDPDAEIDPTPNLWNDANKRHGRIMNLLMTFPGIAIVTARGKEVVVMGPDGRPTENKTRKPEGQKGLAYDVDAWIWMNREPRTPELLGVRSLRTSAGDRLPETKLENGWDILDLDAFIFDTLGAVGPKKEGALAQLRGDELEGVLDVIATCPTEEDLQAVWTRYKDVATASQREDLLEAVNNRLAMFRAPAATEEPGEANLRDHGPQADAQAQQQPAQTPAAAPAEEAAPPVAEGPPEEEGDPALAFLNGKVRPAWNDRNALNNMISEITMRGIGGNEVAGPDGKPIALGDLIVRRVNELGQEAAA